MAVMDATIFAPIPTPTEAETPEIIAQSKLTAEFTPEVTKMPSSDVPASPTDELEPTITVTPVPTFTPSVTVTASPVPTIVVDRSCPEPAPIKPEYDRFFLSPKQWPSPAAADSESHFWLSKPVPGAGRTMINEHFPYGWDGNGKLLLHNGVDIAEKLGTPVLAVADGTVVVAQSDSNAWYGWRCDWYGQLVVIELDETWQDQPIFALYGHVLDLKVEAGQRVSRGEAVAEVGFGGAATNPHLHFEVRIGENQFDATRNAMLWLDPGPTRGVIAGRLVDPEGRPWQGVPLALVSVNGEMANKSTWSYLGDPQSLINADELWAENFVFSDVPPGDYDIYTSIQEEDYRLRVTVLAGQVTFAEIVTEPLKIK
ncbi:MAG: peptidoglycan DD-metalloendopeptidase family protein [Chloroflexi bacterium]|nr:peptidoglycan DD-metalloendopeptidase family protein [Chloroflexota bacterium]